MTELKRGWRKVTLGEVALRVRESGIPSAEESRTYIGLEHMERDSLRIRAWGSEVPLEVTKTKVRKGDILYARRNTHLRRTAVAPFDTFYSPDGYALRTRSEALLQEFLLYVVASAPFHDFAVSRSAGTHSKRVRWDQLVEYEFALPPLEEQRRIAAALTLAEQSVEAYRNAETTRAQVTRSLFHSMLLRGIGLNGRDLRRAMPRPGWQLVAAQDLVDRGTLLALQDGNHGGQYPRASELGTEGLPYIAASDIDEWGRIDLTRCKRIREERAAKLRIPPAMPGDVILTHNATVGRVSRLPDWPTPVVASTSTTYYRCGDGLLPEYLRAYFESDLYQTQLSSFMRQSTRNQVPITRQRTLLIAVPPADEQERLAALREEMLDARRNIRQKLDRAASVKSAVLAKGLGA